MCVSGDPAIIPVFTDGTIVFRTTRITVIVNAGKLATLVKHVVTFIAGLAVVLRVTNITVLIITNKLALTIHEFISLVAHSANVIILRTTKCAIRIGATKMAHITIKNKFKISDTEVIIPTTTDFNWFT
jgi:hypothetical protein